jgi:GntR family transcriptional regulator/MocR family aminotransferase
LQTVGWLAPGIRAERAAKEAAKQDVEVIPLSRYSSRSSGRQGLLLGFAAVDARELRRGVEQLARALERSGGRDRINSRSRSDPEQA